MGANPTDLFHGLFELCQTADERARLASRAAAPESIPDPETGFPLKVATVEVSERAICPACTRAGVGGYVSFVADLRLAFACPTCQELVWLAGA